MDPQNLPMNQNSLKIRFTRRFLQSLVKINPQTISPSSSSSPSPREIFHRHRRVKIAADKSMARAVGSKRVWSRAVLSRMRNRVRQKGFAKRIRIDAFLRRNHGKKNINKKKNEEEKFMFSGQTDELRKIVPGGEAMDLCSLLDETAHYVNCLNTQVEVMRSIVDLYST